MQRSSSKGGGSGGNMLIGKYRRFHPADDLVAAPGKQQQVDQA